MEKQNIFAPPDCRFVDTHAHLYSTKFDGDRNEIVERCSLLGVDKILLPNIDSTSVDAMLETESKYALCLAAMGLHPCSVEKNIERELYVVEDWLAKRGFIAVGEIGLDRYWDTNYYEQQVEAFRVQCQWAIKYNLPIMVHVRDAMPEMLALLEQIQDGRLRGVIHCFTGNLAQAQQAISLGFHLGIGGVATFKNGGLDKVIPHIGADKLILETDSPYLAPIPHRGKRNSPEYIPIIGQRVADLLERPVHEVGDITTQNANSLFRLNYV